MVVSSVKIATLFVVSNSPRNTVTEHTCYVDDTIWKFVPNKMVIGMNIDPNGTIIPDFIIIWRDTIVSGGYCWCFHTWNPAIVVILDRKLFWNYKSSNWDIIFIGNNINSSLPSHTWYLNLGGDTITIGLGSVE